MQEWWVSEIERDHQRLVDVPETKRLVEGSAWGGLSGRLLAVGVCEEANGKPPGEVEDRVEKRPLRPRGPPNCWAVAAARNTIAIIVSRV